MKKDNESKINELKIQLYDLIEQQAVLHHQNQQVEERKSQLAKELGAARQEAAETK